MKGIKLFRWAGKVVWIISWWYLNSDGQADFLAGEHGFNF